MKEIKILDLKPGVVDGIDVQMPNSTEAYKETYFEWAAWVHAAKLGTNEVSGGVLKAWHHVPVFKEAETHMDTEMFYFVSGTAIMLFIDYSDGKPDIGTAQIVRIQAGTQVVIPAGKGHFVAVAEGSDPVHAIVIAPRMEAPRMELPDVIKGV